MSPKRDRSLIPGRVGLLLDEHGPTLAPLLAGLGILIVYLMTMPPGLTWAHDGADGGDLISAAHVLGVPHPPGYPLYVALGHLVARSPLGPAEVALRFNLLSAVAAASAVALLTRIVTRARGVPAGLTAGLAAAFGPLYWSQALVAEVYALNALAVTALIWLLIGQPLRWGRIGLLWGISCVTHLSSALLFPLLLGRILQAKVGPRTAVTRLLPGLAVGLGLFVLPALFAAGDPPINWGNPTNLERWWWLVTGRLYSDFVFGLPLDQWPARAASLVQLVSQNLTVPGVLLGALGAAHLLSRDKWCALGTLGTITLYAIYALGYNTSDSYVLLLPGLILAATLMGVGAGELPRLLPSARGLAWGALLIPFVLLVNGWVPADRSADSEAVSFTEEIMHTAPAQALIYTETDRHTFALWYARFVVGARPDTTIVDRGLLGYSWYHEMLVAQDPRWPPVPSERPVCTISRQGQLTCED